MYTPLPTPSEMAVWDKDARSIYGIRQEMLMENASREALAVLEQELGTFRNKTALLLAGSGNNGGDGFALARHLVDRGVDVQVLHTKTLRGYKGAAGYHLNLARKVGVKARRLSKKPKLTCQEPDIVVDALLGTGFEGEVRYDYRAWIELINALGRHSFVLSLDIPSGLDGSTGLPRPVAVKADATVTFEEAKLGLALHQAQAYTGRLYVRSIGIPGKLKNDKWSRCAQMNPGIVSLYPKINKAGHKGSFGHVLIVGGSIGLTGAAILAGMGAIRSGAGLITVACPSGLAGEVKAGFPDLLTHPLGNGNVWTPEMAKELSSAPDNYDAVIVGPGLGREQGAGEFLYEYTKQMRPPTVWDADALYWLAVKPELKQTLGTMDMLTPHAGEAARLLGTTSQNIQSTRIESAVSCARKFGLVTALKGPNTVVAVPETVEPPAAILSPFTIANLAVGGSGDVLSGIIASLASRGLSQLSAVSLGVYMHGKAGTLLEQIFPYRGNTAFEISELLPKALEELFNENSTGDYDQGSDYGYD